MRYALDAIGAKPADITTVVSNCHHYRVHPFEQKIPFYSELNYIPKDYADSDNLLVGKTHFELSHHLAHAWSCVATAPFDKGLVVVMDGMGETFRAMSEDMNGIEKNSGDYMHDLKLLKAYGAEGFVGVPTALSPGSGYREGESAYVFDGTILKPVYKRWVRQISPPELFNGGFEDMESMGAVYSRISSHILGDWNACGKVMGLAPWASRHRNDARAWVFEKQKDKLNLGSDFYHKATFMTGNPYVEDSFVVETQMLRDLGVPNKFREEEFGYYANIASSIQTDLESSAMALIKSLKESTGERYLALAGGVALNSVLNGRVSR